MFENLANRKGISLDRLVTLCRVAEYGSIMEAARRGADLERVDNRQAQYSKQIADLETCFGDGEKLALLDRSKKPYGLTPAGRELARMARNFFDGMQDFEAAQKQEGATKLIIGSGESMIQWFLMPVVLPALREQLTPATVLFKNRRTKDILKELQDGAMDLGFIRRSAVEGTGLEVMGEWKRGYAFFLPAKMRPKLEDPVKVRDLARYPLAILEGDGTFRTAVERLFHRAGVLPNIQLECTSSTQVAQAVESKQYAGFLPQFARNRFRTNEVDVHAVRGLAELDEVLGVAWNPRRAAFRPKIRQAVDIFLAAAEAATRKG